MSFASFLQSNETLDSAAFEENLSASSNMRKRSFNRATCAALEFISPPVEVQAQNKRRVTTPSLVALANDSRGGLATSAAQFDWNCVFGHLPAQLDGFDAFSDEEEAQAMQKHCKVMGLFSVKNNDHGAHYTVSKTEAEADLSKISRIGEHAKILCAFWHEEKAHIISADERSSGHDDGLIEYCIAQACDWQAQLDFAPSGAAACTECKRECNCAHILQFIFACVCTNVVCKSIHDDNEGDMALYYSQLACAVLWFSKNAVGGRVPDETVAAVEKDGTNFFRVRDKDLQLQVAKFMVRVEQHLLRCIDFRIDCFDDFHSAIARIVKSNSVPQSAKNPALESIVQLIHKKVNFLALIGVCIYDMYVDHGADLILARSAWLRTNVALKILFYACAPADELCREFAPIGCDWSGRNSANDFFEIVRGTEQSAYKKLAERYL
jgi:hypothetical protein